MTFHSPAYLFLLLFLVPVIGWYVWRRRDQQASLHVSDTTVLARQPRSLRVWLIHVPFALRVLTITLLSIALARPQLSNRWQSQSTEGIDIMMVLDVSGTMLAEDLKPNRLEAAKEVATDFVINRPNDNIGLVVFAGESFTQCPLTTDHAVLVNLFQSVKFGLIDDGTAIGLGLANSVNRMKDSPTKSKVIILLTDGSNNRGDITPQTAAEIAKTYGIRVYAVGVGSYGQARVPVQTPYGTQYMMMDSEFDEGTLKNIAQTTGGEYFRATDNKSLKRIYEQIDQLEKSKIRVREYSKRSENFMPFLYAALICLLLDILIRHFALRTIAE
ncbi:MAG: VWA domain-containing protein [Paludibacteraceae bacterium]|nr:VWA domain-containing protein [Paludibacteraceae bacterium]MBR1922316.1 VWA domain-containing protein [Paludibacteraceae bacterium]